jgi:hypothetical protein
MAMTNANAIAPASEPAVLVRASRSVVVGSGLLILGTLFIVGFRFALWLWPFWVGGY